MLFGAIMQRKVIWTETISNDSSETHEFNWARIFSNQNRKNLEMVNNKGDALVYTVGIKQRSTHSGTATGNIPIRSSIKTASNGYVTARAIKAWYKAWRQYLRRNGISLKKLGPYGKSFRFDLTTSDTYDNTLINGEWTNTAFATEAPQDSDNADALETADLIDTYTLTLTGDSVLESPDHAETKYTTVGIIDSWLMARRKPDQPDVNRTFDASGLPDHENNPLQALFSGSMAAEEVMEIQQEALKEDPPYTPDSHDGLFTQSIISSSVHSSGYTVVQCPAGLMQAVVESTLDDNAGSMIVEWEVELLDVSPMVA